VAGRPADACTESSCTAKTAIDRSVRRNHFKVSLIFFICGGTDDADDDDDVATTTTRERISVATPPTAAAAAAAQSRTAASDIARMRSHAVPVRAADGPYSSYQFHGRPTDQQVFAKFSFFLRGVIDSK
jgi:hypothetical protein